MIADIWTILGKEWQEMLAARGSRRSGIANLLLMAAVFGIFLPLQSGRAWVQSPGTLVYFGWVPIFLVGTMTAESFAGERERHTLETLLASRLPDHAIFLGKVLAAVSYGWGITMGSLLLGLLPVNVVYGHGQILLYRPIVFVGGAVLGLLASGLMASVGVFVSLRASTVRQAQQTMSMTTLAMFFVPLLALQGLPRVMPPASALRFTAFLASLSPDLAVAGLAAVLVAADAALLAAGLARFQRARLILD